MALLTGIHVISIVGRQGSGKTTVGKKLAEHYGINHVEASEVVRDVVGAYIAREDMPKTNARTKTEPTWLGDAIARKITDISDNDWVVVTGIREDEVHRTLANLNASLVIIHIDAEEIVRLDRQRACGKCSSYKEFRLHDCNEWDIGLGPVIATAHFTINSTPATKPHGLVAEIVNLLENKDAS